MVKDASNITASPERRCMQAVGFNFYDVFVVGFCVIFALICFYPMWYVLVASVTPYEQFVKGGALLWPNGGVDFQYYRMIFENSSFVTSLWISASKTVLGTLLSVLVTSTMAYAVSKVYVPGMKLLNVLTVFTMFFAGGLIPTYMLYMEMQAHPHLLGDGAALWAEHHVLHHHAQLLFLLRAPRAGGRRPHRRLQRRARVLPGDSAPVQAHAGGGQPVHRRGLLERLLQLHDVHRHQAHACSPSPGCCAGC